MDNDDDKAAPDCKITSLTSSMRTRVFLFRHILYGSTRVSNTFGDGRMENVERIVSGYSWEWTSSVGHSSNQISRRKEKGEKKNVLLVA